MYKQIRISHGVTHSVTWVDLTKPFKIGDRLRLKGDDRLWHVDTISNVMLERKDINRDWHVGGL